MADAKRLRGVLEYIKAHPNECSQRGAFRCFAGLAVRLYGSDVDMFQYREDWALKAGYEDDDVYEVPCRILDIPDNDLVRKALFHHNLKLKDFHQSVEVIISIGEHYEPRS